YGRGHQVVTQVLGEDFEEWLVSDGLPAQDALESLGGLGRNAWLIWSGGGANWPRTRRGRGPSLQARSRGLCRRPASWPDDMRTWPRRPCGATRARSSDDATSCWGLKARRRASQADPDRFGKSSQNTRVNYHW